MILLIFDVLPERLPTLIGYRVQPFPASYYRTAMAQRLEKQFGGIWLWDNARLVSDRMVTPADWQLWRQNFWTSTDPIAAKTRVTRAPDWLASPSVQATWAQRSWQHRDKFTLDIELRRSVRRLGAFRQISGLKFQTLTPGNHPLVCVAVFSRWTARHSLLQHPPQRPWCGLPVVNLARRDFGIITRMLRPVHAYSQRLARHVGISPTAHEMVATVTSDCGERYLTTTGQLYPLISASTGLPSVPQELVSFIKNLGNMQPFLHLQHVVHTKGD